jgi:hypothetical protein
MQQIQYVVHGPFEITADDIRAGQRPQHFWVVDILDGLRNDIGCYVFALAGIKGNFVPHYVGLTRRGFGIEVFTDSNLVKYQAALRRARKRRAALFLVVPERKKGKGSQKYLGESNSSSSAPAQHATLT